MGTIIIITEKVGTAALSAKKDKLTASGCVLPTKMTHATSGLN